VYCKHVSKFFVKQEVTLSQKNPEHRYVVEVIWTGNLGQGTSGYTAYSRDHFIRAGSKPPIDGSSDPAFRGDAGRWNPEDLLVGALAACHKLWYLHLCAVAGIHVVAYRDEAIGIMKEDADKGGCFVRVALHPEVIVQVGDDLQLASELHHQAHEKCFIANSVNFPVEVIPHVETHNS
jgi:organic hydroperoxide reductase OsmC/OhrA